MKTILATLLICGFMQQAVAAADAEPAFGNSMLLASPRPVIGKLSESADENQPTSTEFSSRKITRIPSMQKAMMLSMLLPGAGEYYAGSAFKGRIFMGVEATLWATFIGYRVYGGWKRDDYRSYAAAHAGVDNTGKDDAFYDWIGFYDSREEYNQLGRLYFPERDYLPDSRSYDWQWESEAHRERYKEIKDASKVAFRNSTFIIGLAIINRVISGIDTYRTVKAARKKIGSLTEFGEYRVKISPKPFGHNPSVNLTVSRKF